MQRSGVLSKFDRIRNEAVMKVKKHQTLLRIIALWGPKIVNHLKRMKKSYTPIKSPIEHHPENLKETGPENLGMKQ